MPVRVKTENQLDGELGKFIQYKASNRRYPAESDSSATKKII